ncbi:Host cell attachment-required protein [Candidatus Methylobacter favarea]|uniref:Host cell attachment-required protein n=1 Tax=Candidatus Methylobacter favarea TaxID=2707345 RepID=A0A8S0XUQ3_9GAMM|nr:host attachment protein [Candidatus Methylobacter favarea]CAA9892378.1 Host cell attachment-required protein [Candidatus Methylobacter favarea]
MKLTWILAADNTRARIFTTESSASPLVEIEDLAHTASRLLDREITSDLPGRVKSSNGIGHALEQPTDPKKHEADKFAHQIASYLAAAYKAGKFEQLFIVAEPSFLGLLRSHLPEQIKKQVCFELDKNITTQSAADIRKHLPTYLASSL